MASTFREKNPKQDIKVFTYAVGMGARDTEMLKVRGLG
jgi:hypothetical protein